MKPQSSAGQRWTLTAISLLSFLSLAGCTQEAPLAEHDLEVDGVSGALALAVDASLTRDAAATLDASSRDSSAADSGAPGPDTSTPPLTIVDRPCRNDIVVATTMNARTTSDTSATSSNTLYGQPLPASCPPPDGTRPDPTLVNVDPFVLVRFPLERVYRQLVTLSSTHAPTPLELHEQIWDTLGTRASASFVAPHCDDNTPPSINNFPIECPRAETVLKTTAASVFSPVALVNRFDLAPADGGHCGEYRIVYALTSGANGRNFVIFEGILPNPNPGCGLDACRPIVNFWQSLASFDPSTAAGAQSLADGLDNFYFKGLPGFEPVVHPKHYGAGGGGGYQRSGGQVRTNMFVSAPLAPQAWQLREFHLVERCIGSQCKLVLDPVTVKNNPYHEMFNVLAAAPDARAPSFRAAFPAQTPSLANDDINMIGMTIDDTFNAGRSTAQDTAQDYAFQLAQGAPPNAFSSAIDSALASIGRTDLSASNVAERASTQSCAGCHQLSTGANLGGNLHPTWPFSRGFVHIDERSNLSQALWCEFLPFRKSILDAFFQSPVRTCGTPDQPPPLVVICKRDRLPAVPISALNLTGKTFAPN
jgi:hypothetical protein